MGDYVACYPLKPENDLRDNRFAEISGCWRSGKKNFTVL